MKSSSHQITSISYRLMTAAVLTAILILAPGVAGAIDKDVHEERAELWIKDLHAKLKITAEQEEQWTKVKQVMLDEAKTMDSLTQTRIDHAKTMTAIDDLNSYGEIVEAHAAGIKKLSPVFATLYGSMSDTQKKAADAFFRHGDQENGHHKHGHKKSEGK